MALYSLFVLMCH